MVAVKGMKRKHPMPRLKDWWNDQKVVARFWKYVDRRGPDECWPWKAVLTPQGYGTLNVYLMPKLASRLTYELHHKVHLGEMCALHKCDYPACVNPSHIFVGTRNDNTQDAIRKGRLACGERAPHAKLTNEQAAELKFLAPPLGMSEQTALGRQYGISYLAVYYICSGRNWGSVQHIRHRFKKLSPVPSPALQPVSPAVPFSDRPDQ